MLKGLRKGIERGLRLVFFLSSPSPHRCPLQTRLLQHSPKEEPPPSVWCAAFKFRSFIPSMPKVQEVSGE